jgi:glucose-1-phosphatase
LRYAAGKSARVQMRTVPEKASSGIQVIIFDLGKVIVDFDHHAICRRLARHCRFTPEEIYRRIFASKLEARFDEGRISPEEFHAEAARRLGMQLNITAFKRIWTRIFTVKPGIAALIRRLKKDYRLLCLSNTNCWHFAYCRRKYPVLDQFDSFILSYAVGARKPRRRIFMEALKAACALPEQCCYIDDVPEYVQKAMEMGMHGILFTSAEQLKHDLQQYLAH